MNAHTPGPWHIQPRWNNFIDISHDDGKEGAITRNLCRVQARITWLEEAKANARLIAAAPDLLDALLDMIESYQYEASSENPALLKASAAIAKATK